VMVAAGRNDSPFGGHDGGCLPVAPRRGHGLWRLAGGTPTPHKTGVYVRRGGG